ncbi:DUF349 domain-containing protein [Hahella aquimaris]|uniref:DUF349 domain-containing protein n=1 Tax=Hahella sp. HNIBRBA332 TaxID=3015983 RepID=UPI00273CB126|nr:DUF349 domain-containing protein [Hahella sp. HNIBRBA332]WLQ11262.1 DUF349 domain-containing protein [Hahella sp. HNIBRBA332]
MPTLLNKLFKPKWQSNNPQTRLDAINELDWNIPEQRSILEQVIAKDSEAEVRQAALKKVIKIEDLLKFTNDKDKVVRDASKARLQSLVQDASSNFDNFVAQNLKQASDELLFTILGALNEETQLPAFLQALGDNNSPMLEKIATEHHLSKVRMKAADHIQEPSALERLAKVAKNKDKGLFQLVKGKLKQEKDQEKQEAAARQEVEAFCLTLENHAKTDVTRYYPEKLYALERTLHTLTTARFVDLQQRIQSALDTCRTRAKAMEDEAKATAHEEAQTQELQSERDATCSELENTIEKLQAAPLSTPSELSALDALIKTQENRWLEATRDHKVSKHEQKRYQAAMGEVRHYYSCLHKLSNLQGNLDASIKQAEEFKEKGDSESKDSRQTLKKIRQMVDEVEWPSGYQRPSLLSRAAELMGEIHTIQAQHIQDQKRLKQEALKNIQQLSDAIDDGSVKRALKLNKDIARTLERLPAKIAHDLTARFRLEQKRLEDLKDWQGFATRPKQEELCERMEHLADQHLEPHLKAQRIRELQKEWRTLGGSSDQSLWNRFRDASEKAYEPCREFFSEEEKLKEVNLNKRQEIVHQLRSFIDSVDWDAPDWKMVDKINRKAREEWRQYYPVDPQHGKQAQKHFNELLKSLDERLSGEKARNQAIKADIVKRAEALIAEEDIRTATHQAKALQKEWQSAGITDHREDRRLWSEFRKACDQIFGRLNETRQKHHEEQQHNVQRAEELVTAAIALAEHPDDSTESALASLSEAFSDLGHLGDHGKELHGRFKNAVRTCRKALEQRTRTSYIHYWGGILDNGAHIRTLTDAQSVEWPTELDELQAQHKAQFENALSQFAQAGSLNEISQDEARDLVLTAEILAEMESPAEEKTRRMQLQVERLTAGMQQSAPLENPISKFEQIVLQWATAKTADSDAAQDLDKRLRTALEGIVVKLQPHPHRD